MAFKTKLQVETKVKRDLDLEEETFIQAAELTDYLNDAITIVEAHINTLGLRDKYFLKRTTINLVSGTADYALPADLYEDKIIEVVYKNGVTLYNVKPITGDMAQTRIEELNLYNTSEWYRYRIRRDSSTENYLELVPQSRDTVTGGLILTYYRDIERVSADADLVEVPEIALQYVYQYMKVMVYEKEGHAFYSAATAKLQKLEELMLSTLQGQLADSSNQFVELDKTIYQEMS